MSRASAPSAASPITSMSVLPLEQHPQARADDPVVVGDQDLHGVSSVSAAIASSPYRPVDRHREPNPRARRPAATRSRTRRRPAARARACRRSRARAPAWSKVKPRPSSATVSSTRSPVAPRVRPRRARRPSGGRRSRAPPGRPGRRRAARPAGRRREVALGLEAGARSRPGGRARSTWPASAALRPRSSSAVGRSWRASVEQLLHRLVGERLGLGELGGELRRRLLARRLEPQQQAGQRLVDLVVEVAGDPGPLLLLRGERGARGAPALGLEPLEHPPEGELEPRRPPRARRGRRSGRAGWRPGRDRSARSISSTSCSSGRKRRWSSSTLTRIVSADRERRGPAPASGASSSVELGIGGDRGRDHRGDDQQQVRRTGPG